MKFDKKGAIEKDMLAWIIIGVAVLAVLVLGLILLKDKIFQIGDYLKDFFRFG